MRDISSKTTTLRTAIAEATLKLKPTTIALIRQKEIPKGDPLEVSKVAAIQAAKNTSQIVPYCHQVPLDHVSIEFDFGDEQIKIRTTVKAVYKTGVEMESLIAASVAALTLYDMLKMLDKTMEIASVRLLSKRGGKSDYAEKLDRPVRAAVLVMSDSISTGKNSDQSGKVIEARLIKEGIEVIDYKIIPDEPDMIRATLIDFADRGKADLIITTGGTGFSPRDTTPEAMTGVIDKEIPGIPDALRQFGQERMPYAMLSRGRAGIRDKTIIINLPGSRKGVSESLDALFPGILHAIPMLSGHESWHTEGEE